MKKLFKFTTYFLILLFGQFLLAQTSFADDCDPSIQTCAPEESTPVAPSGGSSSGGSVDGGTGFTYTGVDQRCWTKDDCEGKAFGTFVGPNDETKEACKMEKDSSNKLIGFCLPKTEAKLGLNWGEAGGQPSTYTHIGEFIKWIYRYGIVVASILAVMMIIKAGFDWIISGGNQEVISGAHKKIGNALMGLFLAVMAYFILNLINPYLVNFRLPQIWMINTANLVPPYCDAIKDKKFYFAKETSSEKYQNQYSEGQKKGFKPYDEELPKCGKEYFVEGSGGLTCGGAYCEPVNNHATSCVPVPTNGKTEYKCIEGNVAGLVKYTPIVIPNCLTPKQWEGWQKPAADISETELWAVCSNGNWKDVGNLVKAQDINNDNQMFALNANFSEIEEVKNTCESEGFKFKGMVLMLEMAEECDPTDEEHLIGRLGVEGVDLGDEGHTDKKDNTAVSGGAKFGTANIGLVNDKYFITVDNLKNGFFMNIDATDVHDIDEDSDESVYGYLISS
ncbi:MAG: hypothetical protein HY569_00250 [Candidatus Magasanikbacteria bacterium]|nr:hypothetical protein [Candidatus Magasanikbacteria bacterium]